MDVFSFRTIQSPSEGLYKEKGSKFMAFAFPVTSETEIKQHLQEIRKRFFDARHHCYGYVLGVDKSKFRAYDDGEPGHSAGDPILGQIRSKDLTQVLVIVVRYFGGVKLGVGGLVGAYKAAAEQALNNAVVIEKEVVVKLSMQYEYAMTPEVMRLVKEFSLTITHQQFDARCNVQVMVPLRVRQQFLANVAFINMHEEKLIVQELLGNS